MIVKRIQGALLDFWVAKSAGLKPAAEAGSQAQQRDACSGVWNPRTYHPSVDWSQGGPIVSNEWYVIEDTLIEWFGPEWAGVAAVRNEPLKWFMRAYVVSQFGEEVEDVDPDSLAGSEVRYVEGVDDAVTRVANPLPIRRPGPLGVFGAMLGRRSSRE